MSACIGPIIVFPSWWSIAINVLVILLFAYAVVQVRVARRYRREIERLAWDVRGWPVRRVEEQS